MQVGRHREKPIALGVWLPLTGAREIPREGVPDALAQADPRFRPPLSGLDGQALPVDRAPLDHRYLRVLVNSTNSGVDRPGGKPKLCDLLAGALGHV